LTRTIYERLNYALNLLVARYEVQGLVEHSNKLLGEVEEIIASCIDDAQKYVEKEKIIKWIKDLIKSVENEETYDVKAGLYEILRNLGARA